MMLIKEKDFQDLTKGREKAFETIFCQYYKTLISFALRHELEGMEAEDVVIEAMHYIWEIRENLLSPATLHTLLFTSVHNRCLNVLRNRNNHRRILEQQRKGEREEKEDRFYEYLMEEEVTRLLDQAIDELPGQCRVVVLALLEGKSLAEIAADLDISVNTVKTYRQRALEMLRVALKNHPVLIWILLGGLI